jgi:type VI secretion system protein ImpC
MAKAQATAAESAATTVEEAPGATSDFARLVKEKFRTSDDSKTNSIMRTVQTLAGQALEGVSMVGDDAVKTIEGLIAEIDKRLSGQVNQILHHPDFQQLESAWRGLSHLVNNTESDETLKIRVLNVSKKEVAKTLKKYKGTSWDQSPLFKKIYEAEYDTPGAAPYGCLVGDYTFDHSGPDVEMLESISQIAAAAHAPFFAAAAPNLFGFESWQQLSDPRDLTKIFQTAEYAPWRALRASADSKYMGLTMPRFLARTPYGAKTNPVDDFAFEEETDGSDHGKYVWSNAAYAMAVNINKSFKESGWCARIPCHTFPTDDGGVDMKCPTEIAVTDRREAELTKNGLIPLSHWKNTNFAVFMGAQSLHEPAKYASAEATANAKLGARLPYLFATSRFAHYLKCIVRDKIGTFKERADMELWLNNWIKDFVEPDPANATEAAKAERPLAAAEVTVAEDKENPGYYSAQFFLRPHYQLEGLTVSLQLVSKLPSAKG